MGKLADPAYVAYRDAVGMVMAARRGDQDAIECLQAFDPALKSRSVDVLVAICCGLMREMERMGGEPDALVQRWANNLARKQAGG